MEMTWHQDVRNRSREELISAGLEVLIEQNFTKVGLKEVCSRANISKVTFYKCFASIDEMIFAIQHRIMGEITEYLEARMNLEATGAELLERYLNLWVELLSEQTDKVKFIGFFDHTYSDHYPNSELQESYNNLVQENVLGKMLNDIIERGIADGTLKSSLDANLITHFIFVTNISLMQKLAFRGRLLEQEHGAVVKELSKTFKEFILNYVAKG
ncbi:TetR/AcrR family transcriptional regulator [Paenibacillus sp. MMS20-IR301]|uniref:TetR/AcrR family transcriptional regulator n=1 Tax=Paenibacillus sp. MMS20-IR301 TaxID=2895946 RepID=UPI0028ED6B51|nr:TetR/AcrR family transcriptional regulator [Paenibacillus sp. MMS20-IR301]WNS43993.1 TetR/AcrR family transcriptional regulator [Paenibacillus sp. MMS20-IR301]